MTYTKLTPTRRSLLGHTRLWLAPDHILLLTSTRFAEDYKRFAFSDIQAIVVTDQPSQRFLQILMILAAIAWTCFFFLVSSPFAKGTFLVTGALALLWPILDIARGPRCRCTIHTRVSKEPLPPVYRIRIARKFLAAVRSRIEAAQGVLTADLPEIPTPAPEPALPDLVSTPGYVPEILFGLFLVNAVVIWASTQFTKVPEFPGLLLTTLFAELLLIVVALLRRKGRDPRVITYIVIAVALVGFAYDVNTIAHGLFGWYTTVLQKAKSGDRSYTAISLFPAGRGAVIASSWRAVAGVVGLAAAFLERRKR